MTSTPPNAHFVSPNPSRGGWDVKRAGSERASSHHATQAEAIEAARIVSRNQHTELKIQGRNGQIRQSDSHGHDPRNIKG
ncbi:MAG: DUF2188 domain-containing protein [Patescibacteria group bacterium]|nr:DUF2188 domain-containing protein [Patescibacteria group bacterium]